MTAAALALAIAAASTDVPPTGCAHLRLVVPGRDARAVLGGVSDVVAEDFPAIDAALAPSLALERLLDVADVDAGCPTAWVLVEGTRATVRAAGVGRSRFVFRELRVDDPPSALDRERVGQVTSAALGALTRDGGAMDRTEAKAMSTPAAPPPPTLAVEEHAPRAPFLDRYSFALWYGAVVNEGHIWNGPGVTLGVGGSPWALDPELWVEVQLLWPHPFQQPDAWNQTSTARAGVSVAWRRFRFGAGAGMDREKYDWDMPMQRVNLSSSWFFAGRSFLRTTLFERDGYSASLTFMLDVVKVREGGTALFFQRESMWRPALSLTLGWRS